ncbi:unnamed protein product [Heligmosomoides polygyrus]|uniref:Uncharacterized protein n=1 Tax=Heligmosomoides polygyrus TaxID=6339 RepID=A0A183GNV4_HELPZ|nr:unnamed protein product [Heligmosomoides polygyrus]
MLPSRRKIRRPVNLLVPLELDDTSTDVDTESASQQHPETPPAVVEGEVVDSQQAEDVENGGPGPDDRVQQDDVEEADPGPEVRVQQENVEEVGPRPEVRAGRGDGQIYGQETKKSEWRSPGMLPDLVCPFCGEMGMHCTTQGVPTEASATTSSDEQRCKCRHKRCFDRQRMKKTAFEDLIPKDEDHYWALGKVLHKELASQRIQERRRTMANGPMAVFHRAAEPARTEDHINAGHVVSTEGFRAPFDRGRSLGSPPSPGYFFGPPDFHGLLPPSFVRVLSCRSIIICS